MTGNSAGSVALTPPWPRGPQSPNREFQQHREQQDEENQHRRRQAPEKQVGPIDVAQLAQRGGDRGNQCV